MRSRGRKGQGPNPYKGGKPVNKNNSDEEPNFNLISEIDEYGVRKSKSKKYIEQAHRKYGYSVDALKGSRVDTRFDNTKGGISKVWHPNQNEAGQGTNWRSPNQQKSNPSNKRKPFNKRRPQTQDPLSANTNNQRRPPQQNRTTQARPTQPARTTQGRPVRSNRRPVRQDEETIIRLNKLMAQKGIASRRKSDELITSGKVQVNGEVVTDLGVKVNVKSDKVLINGVDINQIKVEMIYLVMNKPKDTITTKSDERNRKTVLDFVDEEYSQFVVPVGRLDRHTTGVLLLTNDGELCHRMTHPSYEIPRVYHVETNKPVLKKTMNQIIAGVEIDGVKTNVTAIEYAERKKSQLIITLNEGRNREVRKIFEALELEVVKLDRISYGGITSEGLNRGDVRHMTKKEVSYLRELVKLK